MSLYVDPVEFTFVEAEGVGNLTWRFPPSFTVPRMQYDSFAMALLVIRLRRYAGATWNPMGVEMEHRAARLSRRGVAHPGAERAVRVPSPRSSNVTMAWLVIWTISACALRSDSILSPSSCTTL